MLLNFKMQDDFLYKNYAIYYYYYIQLGKKLSNLIYILFIPLIFRIIIYISLTSKNNNYKL